MPESEISKLVSSTRLLLDVVGNNNLITGVVLYSNNNMNI